MGVQGLTAFVDSNPRRLLKDYALHDMRVLIDGNNLYHFLYYYYHVQHQRAGDYDVYRTCIKSFFDGLRKCAVRPYVVFDGAHHEDNRKFKTSLRRAEERLHLGGFLSHGNRAKILPVLTYETFRNVLDEMGVEHVTCYLEADEEIGALAQRWNCPVITNDSDFFVYDLPGGVILIDYLNVAVVELKTENETPSSDETGSSKRAKRYCINAQIYYLDALVRFLKFEERSQVALAATLIGNDVVGKHNFETFYAKAQLKVPINGAQGSPPPGAFAAKVFDWVHSAGSVNDAIKTVIKFIPEDRRVRVRELIDQSIDSYTKLRCSIEDYFEQVESRLDTNPICNNAVVPLSFGGNQLPFWFLNRIRSGSIAVRALNAITRRRVILLTQVEVMSELSAYECSTRLRACFYSILLTVDQSAASDTASLKVQEHSRVNKTLKSNLIPFVERFATGILVPHLTLVPKLCDDERLMILTAALSPSSSKLKQERMQGLPPAVQLLILTVVHWTLHANPKVSDLHVKALLVCCVSLGGLDDYILAPSMRISKDKEDSEMNSKGEPTDLVESVNNAKELERIKTELTLRYSSNPTINNASAFDGRIVHAFCQYQSCLQGTIYLTQLLMLPFYFTLDPARTVNGTFLYNFLLELRSRSNPDLYVEQLLGRGSSMADTVKRLYDIVFAIQPSEAMLCAASRGVRRGARRTKVKPEGSVDKAESGENDAEEEDEVVKTERMSYDVDVTNKFSCLDLMD